MYILLSFFLSFHFFSIASFSFRIDIFELFLNFEAFFRAFLRREERRGGRGEGEVQYKKLERTE